MAQVLGESGRYVAEEAVRKLRKIWAIIIIVTAIVGVSWGFWLGYSLNNLNKLSWKSVAGVIAFAATVWIMWKWSDRKLDELETQRVAMRKGAVGEASVGRTLNEFPEGFHVINDLTTPFGNVDHVVVGPTGVFLIDTKNWRGVVSADGKGELLNNNKPTDKPHVKQFTGRIMGMKEQVRSLSGGLDPYFQGVFAFPSARVDANFGSTGYVHCVRDDRLFDYIVESPLGKKLNKTEVEKIAQAFLALASMDKKFKPTASTSERESLSR